MWNARNITPPGTISITAPDLIWFEPNCGCDLHTYRMGHMPCSMEEPLQRPFAKCVHRAQAVQRAAQASRLQRSCFCCSTCDSGGGRDTRSRATAWRQDQALAEQAHVLESGLAQVAVGAGAS